MCGSAPSRGLRHEQDKSRAAARAVEYVRNGMCVGLGSGSTMAHVIRHLGVRVRTLGLSITTFESSRTTRRLALEAGIRVADFSTFGSLDLVLDGVDAVTPALSAIKGAGGALLREKILARAAPTVIAVADSSKLTHRLSSVAVPVEVLPFALASTAGHLRELGASTMLRRAGGKPYLTEQGNIILDASFADDAALVAACRFLERVPGVIGHGYFETEITTLVLSAAGHTSVLDSADVNGRKLQIEREN